MEATKKKPYNIQINNSKKEPSIPKNRNIQYTDEQKYRLYQTKVEPHILDKISISEEGDLVQALRIAFNIPKPNDNTNLVEDVAVAENPVYNIPREAVSEAGIVGAGGDREEEVGELRIPTRRPFEIGALEPIGELRVQNTTRSPEVVRRLLGEFADYESGRILEMVSTPLSQRLEEAMASGADLSPILGGQDLELLANITSTASKRKQMMNSTITPELRRYYEQHPASLDISDDRFALNLKELYNKDMLAHYLSNLDKNRHIMSDFVMTRAGRFHQSTDEDIENAIRIANAGKKGAPYKLKTLNSKATKIQNAYKGRLTRKNILSELTANEKDEKAQIITSIRERQKQKDITDKENKKLEAVIKLQKQFKRNKGSST